MLFAAPVFYGTEPERVDAVKDLLQAFVDIIVATPPSAEEVYHAAFHLHHCFVLQALLMKHVCFQEEREWRLIYMKHIDDEGELHDDLGYHIGEDGFAQPKLKFSIRPVKGMNRETLHIRDVIERFVVEPAISGPISLATFKKIVELKLGAEFSSKVVGSTIPFRPRLHYD